MWYLKGSKRTDEIKMMNWVLLAVIILIGGGAFLGFKVGFIKTVFSLVSTVIVIIFTMIFSPIVTNLLKNNETIINTIRSGLASVIDLSDALDFVETGMKPVAVLDYLDLELPYSINEMIEKMLREDFSRNSEVWSGYAEEKIEWIELQICNLLTETILNAIGFFITFLIASIGVAILCFMLDIISKLPVLHQINILAGAGAGALEGLVLVWIGFIIITMLGSTPFGQEALGLITGNELLSFLYDNNILSKSILG